jgi:hypothetical protein
MLVFQEELTKEQLVEELLQYTFAHPDANEAVKREAARLKVI